MAFFDPKSGKLVLQIVYDGAAYSGKTASIESLGELVNRPVISPEVKDGRTLLFDWLEYEGGRRYGRPIVCRVLTVPGQAELAHRRIGLLRSADAIVFVVDSRAEALSTTLAQWSSLQMLIERWQLKVSVNLQINKRDEASALPVEEILERLGARDRYHQVFETVATAGDGIRECFVLTVGEAVRHRMARGGLSRDFDKEPHTQPIRPFTADELAEILGGVDSFVDSTDSEQLEEPSSDSPSERDALDEDTAVIA